MANRARRRDTPPPRAGTTEAETLRGFLDYLRTSVAAKVEGAPGHADILRELVDGTTGR